MRVLIIAPNTFPHISGNAITAERWRNSLSGKGITVKAISVETCSTDDIVKYIDRFRPDIIHAHHAFKAGIPLLESLAAADCAGPGIVVSPGGTDLNSDFEMPERRSAIAGVFAMAGAIVVQSQETEKQLLRFMTGLDAKIVRVPKAFCWFGDEPYDLRKIAGCNKSNLLFFLPAGIRPVKGNLECIRAMKKVYTARPQARFVAAGPAVDREYASRFEEEAKQMSGFAVWIEGIRSASMRSAYEASDVVLNASSSEGLSNSLLEALASGRPVLASDIPGNWWPVLGDGGNAPTGLLFDPHDAEDFVFKAIRLIDDGNLRMNLGRASRLRGASLPSPEDEASGLIAAYEKSLARF